jgi:hypothetical protein
MATVDHVAKTATLTDMTEPYSPSSVMPAPKPPPPGWVVPVMAALAATVLLLAGGVGWLLLRPAAATPVAVPLATSTATRTTAPAAAQDPRAAEACRRLAGADTGDFDMMVTIGSTAAAAGDIDIHLKGALLHDRAENAAAGKAQGVSPSKQIEYWSSVVGATNDLRNLCTRKGYPGRDAPPQPVPAEGVTGPTTIGKSAAPARRVRSR